MMKTGIAVGFCAVVAALGLLLTVGQPVAAEQINGTVVVTVDAEEMVSLGDLKKGDIVSYAWTTDDDTDTVDFAIINDAEQIVFGEQEYVYASSGDFTVSEDGTYYLYWYNNNIVMDADITYTYLVTSAPAEEEEEGGMCLILPGMAAIVAMIAIPVAIVRMR